MAKNRSQYTEKNCREGFLAEGISIGKQEGISIGEARGIEKGREEGETKKAIEIAKAMLTKNKPMEEIIEFTGLTIKQIEKLK